jgi:DAK2 domain fusion protein YloV
LNKAKSIDGTTLKRMFINAANTLDNNREIVDSLNVFPVPDGDTGTNMSLTMFSAVQELNALKKEDVSDVVEAIASGLLMGARGNSGVILSQLFRGFATGLKNCKRIDTAAFAKALAEGVETAYKAVMKPTEGTILTVARETARKAGEVCERIKDFDLFLEEILKQSATTLERTPRMLKVLAQAGVVDAGGKGFVYILLGFLKAIRGEEIELNGQNALMTPGAAAIGDVDDHSDMEFPYCTEFIIKNPAGTAQQLKAAYSGLGDCTLVVGDERVIKVHIHTNQPGRVLEEGLKLGELSRIKIENMKEQHRSTIESEIEQKVFGIISVVMGEGFIELFMDLGVEGIIEGGQTMNPSTQDIVKAIEALRAKNIFILPNNGNVILAANQAKELSDKNVYVIPSKSMPQGIAAMIAFNTMRSADDNFKDMSRAAETIKTGQVTYAVRDSVFDGMEMHEGDIIGIADGRIHNKGEDVDSVAYNLVLSLAEGGCDVITVFYGQQVGEEQANAFADRLMKELPDCEIEVHYGGQPVYYYVISVE